MGLFEEAELLNRIMGGLPEKQREVLIMKVYGRLTFQQIARTTGQPQGTVATRYRLAIKKIRSVLQMQEVKRD